MADYPVLDGAGATIIATEKDAAFNLDTNYPVLDGLGAEIVSRKYDKEIDLGPELLTNGGFDSDTAWTKGANWTISGGKAVVSGAQASTEYAYQSALTVGKTYRIVVLVDSITTGPARLQAGNLDSARDLVVGQNIFEITAPGNSNLLLTALAGTAFAIDHVSVKEVLA